MAGRASTGATRRTLRAHEFLRVAVAYNLRQHQGFHPLFSVIVRVVEERNIFHFKRTLPTGINKNVKRVAVVFRFQDGARLINFHFVVFTEGEYMNDSRFT